MPRATNRPRAYGGRIASPQKQSPIKIPLNDDRHEKAVRLQSRQALHDIHKNQIKAAASPMRRLNLYERSSSSSPMTPSGHLGRAQDNCEDIGALAVVPGNSLTPMKRVPILANFEEWMKMATDNKINATNSWNFALIDYFHDMSLLKEGDGVNFQKASCTLDGCVKIYTSRVDSVATETGKLLSGLAENGFKKHKGDHEGEADARDMEDEEDEDGTKKHVRKRGHRAFEATLAPSFGPLSLKRFELEFSVDPLFKKASADFDEGGAKGLLLNHLAIDAEGRIVFDSSDDIEASALKGESVSRESESTTSESYIISKDEVNQSSLFDEQALDIDLSALRSNFFPDLDRLDIQDICPSLRLLDLGAASGLSEIPFLRAPEDWRQRKDEGPLIDLNEKSGIFLDDDDNAIGFDDDNDPMDSLQPDPNAGFGEGGEAWARDVMLEPQLLTDNSDSRSNLVQVSDSGGMIEVGGFRPTDPSYAISLRHDTDEGGHQDVLSYFDNTLQKSWAGPEHWRIRRMKDNTTKASSVTQAKRKEKEPYEIDFTSPLAPTLAELIYTPAGSSSAFSLPRTQRISKTRNLLPDDKHFNSRHLVRLFLKPKAHIGSRQTFKGDRRGGAASTRDIMAKQDLDEAFWAQQDIERAQVRDGQNSESHGHYDANFFQDDGLPFVDSLPDDDDDGNFADARELFSPGVDNSPSQGMQGLEATLPINSQDGRFGSQLITQNKRVRPDYVQYARVAKKVDVRRLKEELWKGFGFKEVMEQPSRTSPPPADLFEEDSQTMSFTNVMNGLHRVYPTQAMVDISTSYCFICLLHLANEKGLSIRNDDGLEDLKIQLDLAAEIT